MTNIEDIFDIEVEGINEDFNDYKWTIYGVAGIGKTTLASLLFDNVAIFQFEKGAGAVVAKKVPIPDWKTLLKIIAQLKKGVKMGKKLPFKTAIFDTDDVAWTRCTQYVCDQNGVEDLADIPYGKGYNLAEQEYINAVLELENLGIEVGHICHFVDKDFQPKVGDKFNQTTLSVPPRCQKIIKDMVNFVVFLAQERCTNEDGKVYTTRRAYFRSNGDIECKAQLKYMPEYIDFDDIQQLAVDIKVAFKKAVELQKAEMLTDSGGFDDCASCVIDDSDSDEPETVTVAANEISTDELRTTIKSKFGEAIENETITQKDVKRILLSYCGISKTTEIDDSVRDSALELLRDLETGEAFN